MTLEQYLFLTAQLQLAAAFISLMEIISVRRP